VPDTTAALASALERVGDRWTLLVVAALLDGPMRYGELADAVPRIATNVLSGRLKDLERQGLVVANPYSRRPLRLEYQLTSVGAELAGVMRMLATWGARSAAPDNASADTSGDGDASGPAHAVCGTPLEVRYWCPTCQQVADDDDEVWA
jgi:DNA-binding HxlR family transcriptional regulator